MLRQSNRSEIGGNASRIDKALLTWVNEIHVQGVMTITLLRLQIAGFHALAGKMQQHYTLVFHCCNAQTIYGFENPNLEMEEIDDLMLTTSEVRKIEALCTRFELLDSVTKALQSDNVKIVKVSPILLDSL